GSIRETEPIGRNALLAQEGGDLVGCVLMCDRLRDLPDDEVAQVVPIILIWVGWWKDNHPVSGAILSRRSKGQVLDLLEIVVRVLRVGALVPPPPSELSRGLGDEQLLQEARHLSWFRGICARDIGQQLVRAAR